MFGYYLTDAGVDELLALLDSGGYRVDLPEDAALLVMAWLLRAGDREAAFDLVEALSSLAHRLRFAPRASDAPMAPADHVHRVSVADARAALTGRRVPAQIERQREALTVWNPLTDRLLELWWSRYDDGSIDADVDAEWRSEAAALLAMYDVLSATHRLCSKHRNPKQNLAIMLASAQDLLAGTLSPRRAGLLASVITDLVAKRGAPRSPRLTALRAEQQRVASSPDRAALAAVAAARLAGHAPHAGLTDPTAYGQPVTPDEAAAFGLPAGSPMPTVVSRVLTRTRSAPIEALLDDGTVPSAEVLGELLPGITATVVAASFGDPALARLMAAHYRAFRNRRSLLLTDLAKQVQLIELPWVNAAAPYAREPVDEALGATWRVGALCLDRFPATILPNPVVSELGHLLKSAGHDVPLTEELAADIFEGRFSPKFTAAAATAGTLLRDSLYAHYYEIDYRAFGDVPAQPPKSRWWGSRAAPSADSDEFTAACTRRAGGAPPYWSVAANGTVIEQAQILTTHNLAALVSVGVRPTRSWDELASAALQEVAVLLERAEPLDRPLATVKDAAYALRQAIFFLSMMPRGGAHALATSWQWTSTAAALPMIKGGLVHVAGGGRFDDAGRCPRGLRFLGWSVDHPWMLPATPSRL